MYASHTTTCLANAPAKLRRASAASQSATGLPRAASFSRLLASSPFLLASGLCKHGYVFARICHATRDHWIGIARQAAQERFHYVRVDYPVNSS